MKSEKGITLTALVVYILIATLLISGIAMLSSFFFSNMNLIKNQEQYAPEFNKFCMFFIGDVKNNKTATVTETKVTFEDGTVYQYDSAQKAIYRNSTKIAEKIQAVNFTLNEIKPNSSEHNITKYTILVDISIGEKSNFHKAIEYTLRYWEV